VRGIKPSVRSVTCFRTTPFSDLNEAESILEDFTRELQEQGLCDIQAEAQTPENECFEFAISAGLAEGKSGEQIDAIIGMAESQQKTIGRFQCEMRR
jgi:hypothetical protein